MPPKPAPTHFLCIPLAGAQLGRSLVAFRADVTSAASFGVSPEAVRPLGTLHLTLGVMHLKNDSLDRAIALLKALRLRDILARARTVGEPGSHESGSVQPRTGGDDDKEEQEELCITLQGLHPMQAASRASVLYAPPVDADGILYRFCNHIKKTFQDAGFMIDEDRPLLLHATIINTIYVKTRHGRGGRKHERLTLDARDIISRYDDCVWIEHMPVHKLAICRMGAKKIEGTDDEAYEVEAEVDF